MDSTLGMVNVGEFVGELLLHFGLDRLVIP